MIIALNGAGRSGKDTGCRLLQELLYPRVVVRDAFADRLKQSAAAALGIPLDVLESLKDDGRIVIERGDKDHRDIVVKWEYVQSIGVRRFLERYGTEAHRDVFDKDFWIDAVMEAHNARLSENLTAVTVITDLRFPNEAEAVHRVGGYVWEITRPGTELDSDHISNQPLDRVLVDLSIKNWWGMREYKNILASALQTIPGVGPLAHNVRSSD